MKRKSIRQGDNRPPTSPDRRRLRLRIVLREGAALGPGKVGLLEAIAETGSIRAAGSRFKMSYRRAWELVAELNGMFAAPLVIAEAGGRGGGGATLTPLGEKVAKGFRTMEAKAWAAVASDFRVLAAKLRKENAKA
jgi:molybdate transport system regulatory protein